MRYIGRIRARAAPEARACRLGADGQLSDVPVISSAAVGVPRRVLEMSPEKLPRLPQPGSAAHTPRRKHLEDDENLTSSAVKGGAAQGLLSLSLGRQ